MDLLGLNTIKNPSRLVAAIESLKVGRSTNGAHISPEGCEAIYLYIMALCARLEESRKIRDSLINSTK